MRRVIRAAGTAIATYATGVLIWRFGGRTGGGHPWSQSWLGGLALAAAGGLWALVQRRRRKHRARRTEPDTRTR